MRSWSVYRAALKALLHKTASSHVFNLQDMRNFRCVERHHKDVHNAASCRELLLMIETEQNKLEAKRQPLRYALMAITVVEVWSTVGAREGQDLQLGALD